MVLMIVLVDACVWRPVLVWAQKFKLEETAAGPVPGSFILRWLRRSWLVHEAMMRVAHPVSEWLAAGAARPHEVVVPVSGRRPARRVTRLLMGAAMAAGILLVGWASWHLAHLLHRVPLSGWGQVLGHTALTLARVFASVVLGSAWTIPVGLWIGQSERRRSGLQPLVQIAASFPAPMLYPLVLLGLHWIGWGLGVGAVLLMAIGTQWYILFNVIAGVSSVPAHLREVARAYHFTPWQRWQKLWWPAMFPYLVTGWVTAAGGAWNASIVAEYIPLGGQISVAPGVGSLISLAASQGHYDLLGASVMVMALVVLLLNRYCWKPLYRMAQTRYAL